MLHLDQAVVLPNSYRAEYPVAGENVTPKTPEDENISKEYALMDEAERERFAGEEGANDNSPLQFENPREEPDVPEEGRAGQK